MLRPFCFYFTPLLIIGIFSSSSQNNAIYFDGKACIFNSGFEVVLAYLPLIGQIILTVYVFKLRDVRKTFGELRDQCVGMVLLYFNLCIHAVVIPFGFTIEFWGFCLLLISNLLCCNVYIWNSIGPPVLGYCINRHECLLEFNDLIQEKGKSEKKKTKKKEDERV